jgi:hypothetical protein
LTLDPSKKKRRKRYVDKTTVDAKGYVITTTEIEWEELDVSDEEEEEHDNKKDKRMGMGPTSNKTDVVYGSDWHRNNLRKQIKVLT